MNDHSAKISTAQAFSLVRNDALFRLQRRLGLIPAEGSGILRRAVLYALLCWLSLVAWAWVTGRIQPGPGHEPLLGHYTVHIRCLVAIPLLIMAEGLAQAIVSRCLS